MRRILFRAVVLTVWVVLGVVWIWSTLAFALLAWFVYLGLWVWFLSTREGDL